VKVGVESEVAVGEEQEVAIKVGGEFEVEVSDNQGACVGQTGEINPPSAP